MSLGFKRLMDMKIADVSMELAASILRAINFTSLLWRRKQYFVNFSKRHGVLTQKTVCVIVTAVRTPHLTAVSYRFKDDDRLSPLVRSDQQFQCVYRIDGTHPLDTETSVHTSPLLTTSLSLNSSHLSCKEEIYLQLKFLRCVRLIYLPTASLL